MKSDLRRGQIQWQCRRGMLELDLLLSAFCEQHFENLPPELQEDFATLLSHSDQELYDWLILHTTSHSERLHEIIGKIHTTIIKK